MLSFEPSWLTPGAKMYIYVTRWKSNRPPSCSTMLPPFPSFIDGVVVMRTVQFCPDMFKGPNGEQDTLARSHFTLRPHHLVLLLCFSSGTGVWGPLPLIYTRCGSVPVWLCCISSPSGCRAAGVARPARKPAYSHKSV